MNNINIPPIPSITVPTTPVKAEEVKKRVRSELEVEFKKRAKELGKVVYSYSRLGSFLECQYGYYESYIKWNRGKDNIYSTLGSIGHDVLEDYTNGKIKKEEMLPIFEKTYAKAKLVGMKFPSDKIEVGYIENLRLFFQEYEIPPIGKPITEMFVCGTFGMNNSIFMQGFIDELYCCKDENGKSYAIISDHKSSTKFKPKDLLKYGRQLAVYAHMYKRLTGLEVKYVQWNMMKYCECLIPSSWHRDFSKLSVKDMKEFYINDCGIDIGIFKGLKKVDLAKIGLEYKDEICDKFGYEKESKSIIYERKDVASKLERHLKWANVDTEVIEEFKSHNLWSKVSDELKQELRALGFDILPYYERYELTDEIMVEMENYIIETVGMIENKLGQPEVMYQPKDIAEDVFFCSNLCNHGDNCKYYKQHINSFVEKSKLMLGSI